MTAPDPAASVLTRSEPTEADYEAATKVAAQTMVYSGSKLQSLNVVHAITDLIWQRAQAALPVPAGRKATDGQIDAGLSAISDGLTEEGKATVRPYVARIVNAALSLPVPADRSGDDAIEIIRAIAPMAKNDAMMMEAMSRHQPVPGTETPEFGAQADDGMLAVNRAFAFIGEPEPFAVGPPLLSLKGEGK